MTQDTISSAVTSFEFTQRTLFRRAANHRLLVMGISLWMLASLVACFFFWPWFPLLGFFGAIMVCGMAFARDLMLVARWTATIQQEVLTRQLRLGVLHRMLSDSTGLPPRTWQGMLETIVPLANVPEFDRWNDEAKSRWFTNIRRLQRQSHILSLIGLVGILLAAASPIVFLRKGPFIATVLGTVGVLTSILAKWAGQPRDSTQIRIQDTMEVRD